MRQSYEEQLKIFKIREEKLIQVKLLADTFKKTRDRYTVVSSKTGVPDDVVFAIHYRESSLSFKTCLHNGDKLPGPTTHMPKNRGPFLSWENGAIDALNLEKNKFPENWDILGRLLFCESYNGLGYKLRGVNSPYIMSWSNCYLSGKYTSDGKYKDDFVDQQCGVAAILIEILSGV